MQPDSYEFSHINVTADYRRRAVFAIFPLLMAGLAIFMAIRISDTPGQNPTFVPSILFVAGVLLIILAACVVMQANNEKIVVEGGTITWTNWLNQVKVGCRQEDVVKGSFRRTLNPFGPRQPHSGGNISIQVTVGNPGSAYNYSVETRYGTIKWSDSIGNFDELCRAMAVIADQPSGPTL